MRPSNKEKYFSTKKKTKTNKQTNMAFVFYVTPIYRDILTGINCFYF